MRNSSFFPLPEGCRSAGAGSFAARLVALAVAVFAFVGSSAAAAAPVPDRIVGFQPRALAIVNAKLVTEPGKVIENGKLVVRDGLIVAVGPKVVVPADAQIIDGRGLIVYPGFIDAATSALLDPAKKPIPSPGRKVDFSRYVLAATRPDNRRGLTPEFRAAENLKPDAALCESLRKLGFTAVHVLPAGRIAGGQGVLLSTSAAPLRESVLLNSTFSQFQLLAQGGKGYPATLMGATAHLRQAFLDAEHHARHGKLYAGGVDGIGRPPVDATLEALHRLRTNRSRLVFSAGTKDDIHRALDFAGEQKLPAVLWGAQDAHRTLDRLEREKVDLIVQLDFGAKPKVEPPKPSTKLVVDVKEPVRVQRDRLERWRRRVGGLAELHRRGLKFAVSSRGLKNRADVLKGLREAIGEGLDRDAALSALTIDAARILGIDDRLGTLSAGKLAHAIVTTGPFDEAGSKVRYVAVDGRLFEYNTGAKPLKPKEKEESGVDLSGRWLVTIESADGKVAATLELAQDGGRLTGAFSSEQGNGVLTSGSVKAGVVDFVVAIGAGARSVRLSFSAKADGKKLTGELKSAFGAATKWSATRVESKQPKSNNPVRLHLERDDAKDSPATAEKPQPDGPPTEIESDRLLRPIKTGGNVLIKNGTVLTATGKTLPATSILVKDGKIAAIGGGLKPEKNVTVIDATGRFVMPGIIDSHSHIKITGGANESTQSIVPEVRIKDVIDTDDLAEYRALAGGVTTARILHGSSNVVGGQDAVVKLKYGATAAEQILDGPQGVKFALGENVKFNTSRFPNTRLGVEATLNRAFAEAADYRRRWREYERARARQKAKPDRTEAGSRKSEIGSRKSEVGRQTRTSNSEFRIPNSDLSTLDSRPSTLAPLLPPRRDLRLETLADVVDRRKFMHAHCYRADEILMLLRVASKRGFRVQSLQHVLEGYKVAPEIAAHGASCSTFADRWAYKVEAYDASAYNAALLAEAGANVVVKSDDAELIRHLYQGAAKTVRYGNMHPDRALQTITLNPARELGLEKRIGSIEIGKDGDLAIFSGHPLNAFSRCELTLIEGEVYFSREHAPTAMSAAAAKASARPPALVFPPAEVRGKQLDSSVSPDGRYAIVGASLHPVDGPDIARGTLLIEGKKIVALGEKVEIPDGTKTIDAAGLHVYPGLIDAGTTLGLIEIGKVRETHDYSESGLFQPDLRAGVAVNPDSELIPVARAGGVTTVLVRPNGGIVSGQVSLVKLDGWTAPDMVLDLEAGLQINWPSGSKTKNQADQLADLLEQARLYDRLCTAATKDERPGPISDPRLEALRPYLRGEKTVFIEANSRRQIAEALLFAEKEKLKIVITGGADAWKLAKELKKRNTPVIVGPVMRRPQAEHDPFDAPYANAGRLHEAGVEFCIRSDSASNSRNVPFEAAMAVAYGLPETVGLRAVTLSAAEILGIDDRVGSLALGKSADLVISDGSLLQPTTQIKGVFIAGKPYPPESRQTRLYQRYRRRLHEMPAADSKPKKTKKGKG